jgi:hypothetical protein
MQNLYGAQTILHSKSLCYSTPPERGHLSRTGHIGGYYMLVYTVFTPSVSTIFLFESCSASCARFDAIVPHSAYVLPRCGVPRKTMALVRDRHMSDLRSAYPPPSV